MVQIDSLGPEKRRERTEDGLDEYMSYIDAMALTNLHVAEPQTRIYSTYFNVRPEDAKLKPVGVIVPSVDSDFFPMFNAPFEFGGPWGRSDDQEGNPVVARAAMWAKIMQEPPTVGTTHD